MKIKLKPLADQVIVIAGASSGIGLVTAKAAAARGAKVMLVARNGAALADAVDAIVAAGGEADHAVADVGEIGELRAAADQATARFGRIDSWVNCAGVAIYGKLLETPADEHERMFRTNYFGVVNGANVAVEHLRAAGGALITIGSIASDIPSPILGAYSASKHATKGYIESLRMELIADRVPISVTLIKPSGIDTPIGEHAANHGAGAFVGEALVPPPVYDPQLVADAILYAAEHRRRDITVGGIGRAQVLFGTHFPNLFDRLGGFLIPLLFDPKRAPTPSNDLAAPARDGHERSAVGGGRKISIYTGAQLHPAATAAGIVGVAALGGALAWAVARRRKS